MDIKGYEYNGCLEEEQVNYILDNYDKLKNEDLFNSFGEYYSYPIKHLVKALVKRDILKPKRQVFENQRNVIKKRIDNFVLENYKTMTAQEMADSLDVSIVSIQTRMRQYRDEGIIGKEYFKEQIKIDYVNIYKVVREHYATKSAKEIAEESGFDIKHIYKAASVLIRRNQVPSKIKRKAGVANDRFKSA